MKLLLMLQATVVLVGVAALVATVPGCGDERRRRTVVVRDYHEGVRHRSPKVIFDRDRHRHREVHRDGHRHGDLHKDRHRHKNVRRHRDLDRDKHRHRDLVGDRHRDGDRHHHRH